MIIEVFFAFYLSLVEYNIFRLIIYAKHLVNSKTSSTFAPRKGEVLEWLKRHAWKACIPQKGIRGSNPRLSAIKGVNQAFARFTPFFTPKNVKLGVFVFFKILQKNVNYKAIGISMDWQNEPL